MYCGVVTIFSPLVVISRSEEIMIEMFVVSRMSVYHYQSVFKSCHHFYCVFAVMLFIMF